MTRTQRLNDEGGWVLVTAAVLMAVMLSIGLMAVKLVDADGNRTREQRETESSLNLDEGVLYAQSLVLAQGWPTVDNHPASTVCQSATAAADASCPSPQNLAGSGSSANFANADQLAKTTWKTKIRDNGGALTSSYDPALADNIQAGCNPAGPCNWDANGDREVWVQAQSHVRGRPRNVVARMRLETLVESTPRTAVTAGALSVTNSGNHGGTPIIDATGSEVVVRCTTSGDCIQAEEGQVRPPAHSSTVAVPSMMTPEQLARFRTRAQTDGKYFTGCPGQNSQGYNLTGPVVWVEGCSSPPTLTNRVPTAPCSPPNGMSTACVNSVDKPGILIWHCGRADLSGGWTYRGVLYVVNNSDGTCPASLPQRGNLTCSNQPAADGHDVLNTTGGFGVWGAVAVDGPGCLKVGSNNLQITFDPRVFDAVESYGTVGLVQNTWRELQPDAF